MKNRDEASTWVDHIHRRYHPPFNSLIISFILRQLQYPVEGYERYSRRYLNFPSSRSFGPVPDELTLGSRFRNGASPERWMRWVFFKFSMGGDYPSLYQRLLVVRYVMHEVL